MGFDRTTHTPLIYHCISMKPNHAGKLTEEVRWEDYSRNIDEQSTQLNVLDAERSTENAFESPNPKTNNDSPNQDELLRRVLLSLAIMSAEMTTLNSRVTSIDTTLSKMSSRVSIMDSRLSAVDMFVTMQRVDKKWEALETSLACLNESAGTGEQDKSTHELKSSPIADPLQSAGATVQNTHSSQEKMFKDFAIPDFSIKLSSLKGLRLCGKKISSNLKASKNPFSTAPFSSTLISLNLRSKDDINEAKTKQTTSVDETSINLVSHDLKYEGIANDNKAIKNKPADEKTINLTSPELKCEDIANYNELKNTKSEENVSTGLDSLGLKCDNKSTEKNLISVKSIPLEESDSNNGSEGQNICGNVASNIKNNVQVTTLSDEINEDHKKSLTEFKINSKQGVSILSKDKKADILNKEDSTSESENEFVIIDEREVANIPVKLGLENKDDLLTVSDTSRELRDFKVCNDITEYLEINLGNKRNNVYPFGFEVKPEYLPAACSNKTDKDVKESTFDTSSRHDDSFLTFMTNFIEKHSGGQKQSSPHEVMLEKKSPTLKTRIDEHDTKHS